MRKGLKVGAVMMLSFLALSLFGGVGMVLAQNAATSPDVGMPDITLMQVLSSLGSVWDLIKSGAWLPGIALVLTVIIRIFKTEAFGGLINKIPASTRVLVPTLCGFLVGLIALLAGHGAVAAFFIAITTGPTSVYWHDLLDWLCGKMGWK